MSRLALSLCLLVPTAALADQTVRLVAERAVAHVRDDDTVTGNQQDFYVRAFMDDDGWISSAIAHGRDIATWNGPDGGFMITTTVPDSQRNVGFAIDLFDYDSTSGNDQFDIQPSSGKTLFGTYNTCTMRTQIDSTGQVFAGGPIRVSGTEAPSADFTFRVDVPLSSVTNDVAIRRVAVVQVVEDAAWVVEGKPTALLVELSNTFSTAKTVTLNGSLNDQVQTATDNIVLDIAPNTVTQILLFAGGGSVTVPPMGPTLPLADGPNISRQPQFWPLKDAGTPQLNWAVTVSTSGEAPGTEPNLQDCWLVNNQAQGSLPVVRTHAPRTLFVPFGLQRHLYEPNQWPTTAEVNKVHDDAKKFMQTTWPIPAVNFSISPVAVPFMPIDGAADGFDLLRRMSDSAAASGWERQVLTVRQGWMAELDAFGDNEATGLSIMEHGPHAVLAESGIPEIAVHELGHTHRLSQRNCDNGGAEEDVLNQGCRDEYTHTTGYPYVASGWDISAGRVVRANLFRNSVLPAALPIPMDSGVAAMNVMGAGWQTGTRYSMWVDRYSYDLLTEYLTDPQDPLLMNLSGSVQMDGAELAVGVPFDGELAAAFQFMGYPDKEAGPNERVGGGWFAVKVVTTSDSRMYRFNPQVQDGYGAFSFTVPVPAGFQRLEFYGPSHIGDEDLNTDVLLDTVEVSSSQPTTMAAAAYIPGAMGSWGTLTPDHDLTLAWYGYDADADPLTAIVLLDPPDADDGMTNDPVPVTGTLSGNTLKLPHQLFHRPGSYGVSVILSDGTQSHRLDVPDLFEVCIPMPEVTDQLDNDCDGAVDEHLSHDVCETGGPLWSGHSWCAADICNVDPYCCSVGWDGLCVSEVGTVCEMACP